MILEKVGNKLMTKIIRQVNSFKKDIKRVKRRRKDIKKLYAVIEQLANDKALAPVYRPHRLSGNWGNKMECHIEPDWLLIYEEDKTTLTLYRTGTHSDLF